MRMLMVCALSVCVLSGVPGCKPKQSKAEREAIQAEALRQEVEAQFAAILDLQAKGETDAALEQLELCLFNPKYDAYRPRFFVQKVDLLLAQDKSEAASAFILKAWEKEPQLALGVFDRIRAYHQGKRDHAAILAWCKQLLGMGKGETLPKHLRPLVLEWQLSATTALGDTAALLETVDLIVAELQSEKAVPLLQQVINTMISTEKFAPASALITHLAAHPGATAQTYKDLAATSNLRNLMAQKDWQKVPGAFEICAVQLQDKVLLAWLRQMFPVLQKNQQMALLENTSQRIFMAAPSKHESAGYAARVWVGIGVAADKTVLPERLIALLDAKVQPEQIATLLEHHFYELGENPDAIKRLCAIGERIASECSDLEAAQALKLKLVDGMFIMGNYDLAIEMLEKGIPNQTQAWHDMALPKAKAHRALAQDKPLEAIGYFRAFMKTWMVVGPEEEQDPITNVTNSKEWILGRNAHRIATIYESVSDTANAAKAREEAKAFLAIAQSKAEKEKDAEALKVLKAEMKGMGF